MKKIKLNIFERLFFINNLPKSESYEILIVSKDIGEKIQFTQKESSTFKFKTDPINGLTWDVKFKNTTFNYNFTELEWLLLKDTLNKSSKEKKLPIEIINLYKTLCL